MFAARKRIVYERIILLNCNNPRNSHYEYFKWDEIMAYDRNYPSFANYEAIWDELVRAVTGAAQSPLCRSRFPAHRSGCPGRLENKFTARRGTLSS